MSLQLSDRGIRLGRSSAGWFIRLAVRHRIEGAVVILQDTHRYIEQGLSPIEAALSAQCRAADDHRCGWGTESTTPFRGEVL
jgi:hypothetical protein